MVGAMKTKTFKIGDKVRHPDWGPGRVVDITNAGFGEYGVYFWTYSKKPEYVFAEDLKPIKLKKE